ncbi:MAG TPA: sulfatase-like hydrolase/transferase [Verrucomicrobiae bacterium]
MKSSIRFLIALLGVLCGQLGAASAKPNIIFILSDDVGIGNISCYSGAFKTPNIDALAKGGTRFEYCYANPVCGPSRATCLSGRYVFRTGMLTNGYTDRMHKEEILLPKVMKPAGYVTAHVGKWAQLPFQPVNWGFDEYLRFEGSGKYWSSQVKTYMQNNQAKELGDRYLPDVMHKFLVDFMTRHKDQPFYVHYAMSHMHARIMRTPDSAPGSKDFYADNNAYMDKLVGKLVAALDKLGLREKTLLVFVGDNGTGEPGAAAATVDGRAISGQKGTMLEGGSRVPLIVNWPGTTPAGKVLKDLTDFTDFLPTFAELAGAKLPDVKIDGHSFAAQIKGQPGTPREWVYVQLAGDRYIRDGRWKFTGDGKFFDLKEAPFKELAVAADTTDPEAKAGRAKLQALLGDLKSQDTTDAPPRKKKDKKKKAKA